MKTKCYSVRLESLVSISDKAFKAVAFDGSEAIIPKSQFFGQDYDVQKSEAYWIAAWILEKKDLQYSSKKEAWIDNVNFSISPEISFKKHKPQKIKSFNVEPDNTLRR